MPNARTPYQDVFFRAVTMLANTQTVLLLVLLMASLCYVKRRTFLAAFVVLAAVSEETTYFIIKHLVQRLRPDEPLRLIQEVSYSFPSGHAVRATVLYGLLAYFVYRAYTSAHARLLTLGLYVMTVFMICISRIYFGVHYPTDVWAGVQLGLALLAVCIGILETVTRHPLIRHQIVKITIRPMVVIPIILVVFSFVTAPFFVRFSPTMTTLAAVPIPRIDADTIQRLPLYSETLTGSQMEPINFVYIGYQDQINNLFTSHGWQKADPSTLNNTLRAVAVGFQGGQYETAPVTPSFLNAKPETIAFQKGTELHSLRQRHHTRLWRTDFALPDGRPVWVATASFDEGIKFAGTAKLPTHHINPNIDAERAFIVKSLAVTGNLLQVVEPQLGKNASGDGFFTDGKAEVIELK